MNQLEKVRRRPAPLALAVAAAALLFVAGAWPSDGLRIAFAEGYSRAANEVLERITFANGGRVRMSSGPNLPSGGPRAPERVNVAADATLSLSADGRPGTVDLGINLRRDAYLPLLLFVCFFLPAPVRWRYKAGGLATGAVIVLLASAGALWMLIAWAFDNLTQTVHGPGSFGQQALDLACRLLLAPPANRIIGPLLLAAALTLAGLSKREGSRMWEPRSHSPALERTTARAAERTQ